MKGQVAVHCTLVTYSGLPDLDPDDRLILDALVARGVDCAVACWDDADYPWDKTEHVVLRSTWDYHLHLTEFMAWIDRISSATTIWNSPNLIKWNVIKTYLLQMQELGVPVVPTRFLRHGTKANLEQLISHTGWHKAIIKPTVGLATHGVQKVSSGDLAAGQFALDALLEDGDVLMQRFMHSVNDYGERSLVYIGGTFSHAVRKAPFQKLAAAGHAGESAAAVADDELAVAQLALECLPQGHPPLYARVDLVRDDEFRPLLMELELVEPSLFVGFAPGSAGLFAEKFLARVAEQS